MNVVKQVDLSMKRQVGDKVRILSGPLSGIQGKCSAQKNRKTLSYGSTAGVGLRLSLVSDIRSSYALEV